MRSSPVRWVLALALGVSAAACGAPDGPTSPDVAPQFAKGGKPGGGGTGGEAATLDEYWVFRGSDGVDQVHIVVSNADRITKNVSHDFFFNGVVDDDAPFDQHYEWYDIGATTPPTEVLADGRAHVDLPFNGERNADGGLYGFYKDFPATSVGDSGADPFVFRVYAYSGSKRVGWFTPLGVINGGVTLTDREPAGDFLGATHLEPVSGVRSYATFQGGERGGSLWLSSVEVSDLACTGSSGGGRGKKATTSAGYTISATVTVSFDLDPLEPNGNVWWEGHFMDPSGVLSHRMAGTGGPGPMNVSLAMPEGWSGSDQLEFVVDFVRRSRPSGASHPMGENAGRIHEVTLPPHVPIGLQRIEIERHRHRRTDGVAGGRRRLLSSPSS